MLDNEPEGGDRTGSEPAGDTATESTTPVKRTRTRRKAVEPVETVAEDTPAPTRRRRTAASTPAVEG